LIFSRKSQSSALAIHNGALRRDRALPLSSPATRRRSSRYSR
jgi:hypothetical protein